MKPKRESYTSFMLNIYGSAVHVFPFCSFYYNLNDKEVYKHDHERNGFMKGLAEDGFAEDWLPYEKA